MNEKPKQGPWTRIRPLQITEVDSHTAAAFKQAEVTWGGFPNNLIKVMGYCPRLAQTEVEYCNTFIFDPEPDLAETIFHELGHQRVFASGDTDFNEAFATAVGEEGARRWLEYRSRCSRQPGRPTQRPIASACHAP